jgi:hypothetical protein
MAVWFHKSQVWGDLGDAFVVVRDKWLEKLEFLINGIKSKWLMAKEGTETKNSFMIQLAL